MAGSKKVLVVDDEPAIQKIIKLQLESEGYTVIVAGDWKSAVAALDDQSLMAMLLDLHLADCDGFQVLGEVKKKRPGLPVIMVTGSLDQEEAKRAFSLGAWDYVTKPIDFNYLKNILLMQSSQ